MKKRRGHLFLEVPSFCLLERQKLGKVAGKPDRRQINPQNGAILAIERYGERPVFTFTGEYIAAVFFGYFCTERVERTRKQGKERFYRGGRRHILQFKREFHIAVGDGKGISFPADYRAREKSGLFDGEHDISVCITADRGGQNGITAVQCDLRLKRLRKDLPRLRDGVLL